MNKKKMMLMLIPMVFLLTMTVPAVMALTNIEFEGHSGTITIESWGSGRDIFEIGGGHYSGWQTVESGSLNIERWATFDSGSGWLNTFSSSDGAFSSNDASIETWATGHSGYLGQTVSFTDTLMGYDAFVVGASSGSPYTVGVLASFDDTIIDAGVPVAGALFVASLVGEGSGELSGTSLHAVDDPRYWIFGGNTNPDYQPIAGAAEGSGDFELGAYGDHALYFDFNWQDDDISGTTYSHTGSEGLVMQWGSFDTSYSFNGIVRAYEPSTP